MNLSLPIQYRLSIIIVSYNTCEILRQCLNHLRPILDRREVQTIVIDNQSSDGSPDMVRRLFPEVFLLANGENIGFARGVNQGLSHARGEYILFLNSDAFVVPESIKRLVDFLDQHREAGVCGPQLVFPDGGWQSSSGRFISPLEGLLDTLGMTSLEQGVRKFLWKRNRLSGRPKRVGYIHGACMLVRSSLFATIAPLDEGYFFFGEDMDFCFRVKQAGWKIYLVPESRIIHLRGSSYRGNRLKQVARYKRQSLERFITHYQGGPSWKCYAWLMRANFFFRYILCKTATHLKINDGTTCLKYKIVGSAYRDR
jgi:hypothetical protein